MFFSVLGILFAIVLLVYGVFKKYNFMIRVSKARHNTYQ